MNDIKSMLLPELEEFIIGIGEPKYRAKQIYSWLNKGVTSFNQMRNIPASLQKKLAEVAFIDDLQLLQKQVSSVDGTAKYLWRLTDGNSVETVVMRYEHGLSVCISSQVGCRQGCAFCASTIGGLVRNLSPSEMLDEVLFSQLDQGEKISNVVIMGIGEPLDNYENVLKFLRLVNAEDGLNIGMRHITLSTCGITERIHDLAKENLQITLAISLHAADDCTRSMIMPINRTRGIESVIQACSEYFQMTGRRITFEYAMIDGVNDSSLQAEKLSRLAKEVHAHVNLIPLNHVEERALKASKPEHIQNFCKVLDNNGVNYTIRRTLGSDVDASCGQLRRKRELAEKKDVIN